jgi:hypothetical protein
MAFCALVKVVRDTHEVPLKSWSSTGARSFHLSRIRAREVKRRLSWVNIEWTMDIRFFEIFWSLTRRQLESHVLKTREKRCQARIEPVVRVQVLDATERSQGPVSHHSNCYIDIRKLIITSSVLPACKKQCALVPMLPDHAQNAEV